MTAVCRHLVCSALGPWGAFLVLPIAAWAVLLCSAAGIAGAAALGPGMARLDPLAGRLESVAGGAHAACGHHGIAWSVGMWMLMCAAMMATTAVPMLRANRHLAEAGARRIRRAGLWVLPAGYPRSGKVRGTTALFSVLVGSFLGAGRAPVSLETGGTRRRRVVPRRIVGEVERIAEASSGKGVVVSSTGHWMAPDIELAHATRSRVRAFGRVWDLTARSAEICPIGRSGP